MVRRDALQSSSLAGVDESLQAATLESGDPELAYRFAHDYLAADLNALEKIIINGGIPRIAYDFALIKGERGGDVSELQNMILNANDPALAVLFAVDVTGADIEHIEDFLRQYPDPKYLQLLEHELRQHGYY